MPGEHDKAHLVADLHSPLRDAEDAKSQQFPQLADE
jgi:hypothetical protein